MLKRVTASAWTHAGGDLCSVRQGGAVCPGLMAWKHTMSLQDVLGDVLRAGGDLARGCCAPIMPVLMGRVQCQTEPVAPGCRRANQACARCEPLPNPPRRQDSWPQGSEKVMGSGSCSLRDTGSSQAQVLSYQMCFSCKQWNRVNGRAAWRGTILIFFCSSLPSHSSAAGAGFLPSPSSLVLEGFNGDRCLIVCLCSSCMDSMTPSGKEQQVGSVKSLFVKSPGLLF